MGQDWEESVGHGLLVSNTLNIQMEKKITWTICSKAKHICMYFVEDVKESKGW